MSVTLYMSPLSQPSRAIHLLLLEGAVPHELHVVDMLKREQYSEAYKAINPNGQLPSMKDGDFSLFESHAIMAYLVGAYHLPDHWYPSDIKSRAIIDQYLHWHHGALRRGGAGTLQTGAFSKMLRPNANPEELKVEHAQAQVTLKQALQRINDSYLEKGPFLMGAAEISIADLAAVQEIVQLDLINYDYRTEYPNIKAWIERVQARTEKSWAVTNAVLNQRVEMIRTQKKAEAAAAAATSSSPTN